jgi:HD superfamily phosphohydrolase
MMMSQHRWRWLQMADPVHGMLQFDRQDPLHQLVLATMATPVFQRLRRIRQMGLAEFVFPGAVHTRFSHSLGATHLMLKALGVLKQQKSVAQWLTSPYQNTGVSYEVLLVIGILLHDVGHSALSHTLEDILNLHGEGMNHDHYWLPKILKEDPHLNAVWQQHHVPQLPQALLRFMGLAEGSTKHGLAALVSSQLDMDRLDYLLRDSHFMGTRYGNIEAERIIGCLELEPLPEHPEEEVRVVFQEDGLPAIEHYLFGRYQSYKMALHSLDKASEALLKLTLKRFLWASQQGIATGHSAQELLTLMSDTPSLPLKGYLRMDDHYLWEVIHCWSEDSEDPCLKELALRLMSHDLLKFVDLNAQAQGFDEAFQAQLKTQLRGWYEAAGLNFEFGFDEEWVEQKPLYRHDKEPIWLRTRDRGILELPEASSLHLGLQEQKGAKHLWFVANRGLQHRLQQALGS